MRTQARRTINAPVELVMEAKPYKMAAKLTTPMIKGPLTKALEQDMDAVKAYCEK